MLPAHAPKMPQTQEEKAKTPTLSKGRILITALMHESSLSMGDYFCKRFDSSWDVLMSRRMADRAGWAGWAEGGRPSDSRC
eukprot:1338768-Amorphochlora_amoeboformis.AAC.1